MEFERLARATAGARREPAVAVVQARTPFVEARKLARQVVERLALDRVGSRREVEGPSHQPGGCALRDRPVGVGEQRRDRIFHDVGEILSPSSQAFIGWKM